MKRKTVQVTNTREFSSDVARVGKQEQKMLMLSLIWYAVAMVWDAFFAVVYLTDTTGSHKDDNPWFAYVMWVLFTALACAMYSFFRRELRTYRSRAKKIAKLKNEVAA